MQVVIKLQGATVMIKSTHGHKAFGTRSDPDEARGKYEYEGHG